MITPEQLLRRLRRHPTGLALRGKTRRVADALVAEGVLRTWVFRPHGGRVHHCYAVAAPRRTP